MTQYLITKREKCDYYEHYSGGHANCKHCDKQGNIDTPVDLLEVLAKVRWSNSPLDFGSPNRLGDNLHIEEGE